MGGRVVVPNELLSHCGMHIIIAALSPLNRVVAANKDLVTSYIVGFSHFQQLIIMILLNRIGELK